MTAPANHEADAIASQTALFLVATDASEPPHVRRFDRLPVGATGYRTSAAHVKSTAMEMGMDPQPGIIAKGSGLGYPVGVADMW